MNTLYDLRHRHDHPEPPWVRLYPLQRALAVEEWGGEMWVIASRSRSDRPIRVQACRSELPTVSASGGGVCSSVEPPPVSNGSVIP